jgi:hypothetical protein
MVEIPRRKLLGMTRAFLRRYQGWDVAPDHFCIGAIRSAPIAPIAPIALAFRACSRINSAFIRHRQEQIFF